MPEVLQGNLRVDETQTPRRDPLFTPATYLRAIREVYARLVANPVGRIVVNALARDTVIIPWPDVSEQNADAAARGGWDGERRATPRGRHPRYCGDVPGTPEDETGRIAPGVGPGLGTGADQIVRFTPWMFWGPFEYVPPVRRDGLYAPWADEVLVHELLHAAQGTRGVASCAPAGHNYDTFSEFCAITVENMYAGCVPGRPVRLDHHGHRSRTVRQPDDPLPPTAREVREAEWMARFRLLMGDVVRDLEAIPSPPARYNPFTAQRREDARALRVRRRRPRPSSR